jgi:hypothetical protein
VRIQLGITNIHGVDLLKSAYRYTHFLPGAVFLIAVAFLVATAVFAALLGADFLGADFLGGIVSTERKLFFSFFS